MLGKVELFIDRLHSGIKIGPHTVRIKVADELKAYGDTAWGTYDGASYVITLNKSLMTSKALVVETVLHELMHALWHHRALPNRPKEERVVGNLSLGLTQVFQDNPWLLEWIRFGLYP